jgi:hypothetical protein
MMPPEDHCYAGILARCQEGSWPKDEILYFLGSSWVLGEIVVKSYLFILVYANFDQCVEIGEDGTKPCK